MQATNHIQMLSITAQVMGRPNTIHPVLLWDQERALLVDTGYPGQLPLFEAALEEAGVSLHKLQQIIITHQDIDHIGSLSAILGAVPGPVEVLATEIEKPYIQGERRLVKVTDEAIARLDQVLPSELPEAMKQAIKSSLLNPPKGRVDTLITPGQELPYGGGLIVIATPGHTPGHISLYHKVSKTLIAGDALIADQGRLLAPPPEHCVDWPLAMQSLKALTALDIQTVMCYHGGLCQSDVNGQIAELAAQSGVS